MEAQISDGRSEKIDLEEEKVVGIGEKSLIDINEPQENQIQNEQTRSPQNIHQRDKQVKTSQSKSALESEFQKLCKNIKYAEYYEFQKLLGQGAFCSVYQAMDKKTEEIIAVKVIRRKNLNNNDVNLLRQEAKILKELDHENIVQFKHMREIGGRIFLGMELMKSGQLAELIKAKRQGGQKFTDEEASKIMKGILKAVQYIHLQGIIHRDLKPADFGLSAKYEHSSFASLDDHCGTLIFMAPEVASKKEYSKSVDIWSTGIIMYMLLTGGSHPLYSQSDDAETYKEKLKKAHNLSFPSHFSILAKNLFSKLTRFNISQRYSAAEALQHPWITRLNKSLIPLTLPDRMKHIDLEFKLQQKMSLLFFLSVVKSQNELIKSQRSNLDKVSKKIDKWHEESKGQEIFARDEEYIELDQSPTNFETSSDEDDSTKNIDLQKKITDSTKFSETNSSSHKKNPKNYHDFKLSLQETVNLQKRSKLSPDPLDNKANESIFKFMIDTDNKDKLNLERKQVTKKGSQANSPMKRDSIKKVKTKSYSQVTESTISNQHQISDLATKNLNPESNKINNSSFSTYINQYSPDIKQQKKQIIALCNHVNYNSSKVSEDSPQSLRTTFVNSDRQTQNLPYNQQNFQNNKQKQNEVSMVYNLKSQDSTSAKRNNVSQRQNTFDNKDQVSSSSPQRKVLKMTQKGVGQNSSQNNNQINLQDILKKNEGYDQKFLFKKNFIPKQKPVMMPNQLWQPGLQQYKNLNNSIIIQNSLANSLNQVVGNNQETQMRKPRKKSQQIIKMGTEGQLINYITLHTDFDARMIKASELQNMALKFWETSHQQSENISKQQKLQRPKRSGDLPYIVSKQQAIQQQQHQLQSQIENQGGISSLSKQQKMSSKSKIPYHLIKDADIEFGRPNSLGNSNHTTFSKQESPYIQPHTQMLGANSTDTSEIKGSSQNDLDDIRFQQLFYSQNFNLQAKNSQKKIRPANQYILVNTNQIQSRFFDDEIRQSQNEAANKSFDPQFFLQQNFGSVFPNKFGQPIIAQNKDSSSIINVNTHKRVKSLHTKQIQQQSQNLSTQQQQLQIGIGNSNNRNSNLGILQSLTGDNPQHFSNGSRQLYDGVQGQHLIVVDHIANNSNGQISKYKNKMAIKQQHLQQ